MLSVIRKYPKYHKAEHAKKHRVFNVTSLIASFFILSAIVIFICPAEAVMQNLSKSFVGQEEFTPGSLVSLNSENNEEIVLATAQNADYLVGVVVDLDTSLLAVNSGDGNTQVAISGQVMTLVSDISGDIVEGDLISQSAIDGVGAKAKEGDRVLGIAQIDFNSSSDSAKQETIIDAEGQTKEVTVGLIPVLIVVSSITEEDNLSSLERWAAKIVGKPVSATRISVCAAIAIVGIISIIVLMFSSVRNAITAAGRNPLAKPVIFESLAQIMSLTVLISIISVAAMYIVAVL